MSLEGMSLVLLTQTDSVVEMGVTDLVSSVLHGADPVIEWWAGCCRLCVTSGARSAHAVCGARKEARRRRRGRCCTA